MKKAFILSVTLLFICIACNKSGNNNSDNANTLTINTNNKTYKVPIVTQLITYSGTAQVNLYATFSELDVQLQAKSYQHNSGVGDYFLYCCNNDVLEKFANGQHYSGIEQCCVNSSVAEKGSLKVTRRDEKGFEGTYTFNGKSSSGQEKVFSGTFKIDY